MTAVPTRIGGGYLNGKSAHICVTRLAAEAAGITVKGEPCWQGGTINLTGGQGQYIIICIGKGGAGHLINKSLILSAALLFQILRQGWSLVGWQHLQRKNG